MRFSVISGTCTVRLRLKSSGEQLVGKDIIYRVVMLFAARVDNKMGYFKSVNLT